MARRYSVLFVDDEINILLSLKRGFIDEAYDCYFASSAKEALEIMDNQKISVIVSDMRMPEMDGLALLKKVKELYPKTIRIVLSGYTQLQQVLASINHAEIFKFIIKPWKLESEFKVIIKQAVEYYKIQEETEGIRKVLQGKDNSLQNIVKGMEESAAFSKKSNEMLGECGKLMFQYNGSKFENVLSKEFRVIQVYEEKIYDLFTKAVQFGEKEIQTDELISQLKSVIEEKIKITKVDDKREKTQLVKTYTKIGEAIIRSTMIVFKNEFSKTGVYLQISENKNNKLNISLVAPNAYLKNTAVNDEVLSDLDIKMEFMNMVIGGVASICNMTYCANKTNGNLVVGALLT